MGKIRVKVLGDAEAEKKQKEEAKKRIEAKKLEKSLDELSAPETTQGKAEAKTTETPKGVSAYAKKAALKNKKSKAQTPLDLRRRMRNCFR